MTAVHIKTRIDSETLTLPELRPFVGKSVEITVVATEADGSQSKLPISAVRALLRGKMERFDEPTDPMIPDDSWEMNQ